MHSLPLLKVLEDSRFTLSSCGMTAFQYRKESIRTARTNLVSHKACHKYHGSDTLHLSPPPLVIQGSKLPADNLQFNILSIDCSFYSLLHFEM